MWDELCEVQVCVRQEGCVWALCCSPEEQEVGGCVTLQRSHVEDTGCRVRGIICVLLVCVPSGVINHLCVLTMCVYQVGPSIIYVFIVGVYQVQR